jgi:hypothetical protein
MEIYDASIGLFIEEKHKIENLWPTFYPKELFEDFYETGASINADATPTSSKLTFAHPWQRAKLPRELRQKPSRECLQLCLPTHLRSWSKSKLEAPKDFQKRSIGS